MTIQIWRNIYSLLKNPPAVVSTEQILCCGYVRCGFAPRGDSGVACSIGDEGGLLIAFSMQRSGMLTLKFTRQPSVPKFNSMLLRNTSTWRRSFKKPKWFIHTFSEA